MKLKDLTEKQVVQTTEENHEKFMKLLDKEGFKWYDGDSYLDKSIKANKYEDGTCYRVKTGMSGYKHFYEQEGCEIIPASKFLKPSKKELIARIERLEKSVFPINQTTEPTEPKKGDLCAFADYKSEFDNNQFRIGELADIILDEEFRYKNKNGYKYKYARKVEIKFI